MELAPLTFWIALWICRFGKSQALSLLRAQLTEAGQQRLAGSIIYCNKIRESPTNRWCQSSGSLDLPAIFLIVKTRRQFFPSRCPKAPSPSFCSADLAKISFSEPVPDRQTPAAPEPEMGKEVRRIQPSKVCCSQCCRSSESLSSLAKLSGKFTSHRTKIACRLPQWLMVMQETNGILLACRKKLLTLGQQDWGRIL